MFVTRAAALVPPDAAVLNQLLRLRPKDELGSEPQLRVGGDADGSPGEVPAVVINNAVLRQHFRKLTHAFLKPFNRYFYAGGAVTAKQLAGVGPYDDLAVCLLPKFSEDAFLDHMKGTGPPRLLRKAKWRKLYQGFIGSPHFWPWFRAREQATARKLYKLARRLRLATSVEVLLAAGTPTAAAAEGWEVLSSPAAAGAATAGASATGAAATGAATDPQSPLALRSLTSDRVRAREEWLLRLKRKIEAAFLREAAALKRDPDLKAVMRHHLQAVQAALPA